MIFKMFVSSSFVALLLVRTFKPTILIDNTSVIILLLAFSPWAIQYIRSLEINGIGKVELFDKEKKEEIELNAQNAGLIEKDINDKYTFNNIRNEDVKLALAGLRIEIEDKLRSIAKSQSLETTNVGLTQLTKILSQHHLLDSNEINIIKDLTGVLNKAVHSQISDIDNSSFDWAFDIGLKLLHSLEYKYNNN